MVPQSRHHSSDFGQGGIDPFVKRTVGDLFRSVIAAVSGAPGAKEQFLAGLLSAVNFLSPADVRRILSRKRK